ATGHPALRSVPCASSIEPAAGSPASTPIWGGRSFCAPTMPGRAGAWRRTLPAKSCTRSSSRDTKPYGPSVLASARVRRRSIASRWRRTEVKRVEDRLERRHGVGVSPSEGVQSEQVVVDAEEQQPLWPGMVKAVPGLDVHGLV